MIRKFIAASLFVMFCAVALNSPLLAQTESSASAEAKTPSETAEPKVALTPEPAPTPTPAPDKDPNSGSSSFVKKLQWTAIFDGYYAYNFNRPDDHVNSGFLLESRHNRPTLSMAKFNLEKPSTLESPFGFRFDVMAGPGSQLLLSTRDRAHGLEATRFLWQGYVSYTAPLGKGLTIDFGKFTTPIGIEGVDSKDNVNYSHSYLYNYAPVYHTGLRAKYAFNDKVSVTGYAVNGWDSIGDNNSGKTFGFTVAVAPRKNFNFSQTYLTGPENALDNGNWRNIFDTMATYIATDKLTFMGDFVYGNTSSTLGLQRDHWSGVAGYAKYAFTERLALAGRYDTFRDQSAFYTGLAQTLHGFTMTQEVKLKNNLVSKFEFRRGVSNQDFFTASQGTLSKDQNVGLIGVTWFFQNKK